MTTEEREERRRERREFKYDLGKDLLDLMQKNEDLPLPNKRRLCEIMQEYFISEGMIDRAKAEGSDWKAGEQYWRNHLGEICDYIAKEYKIQFGYVPNKGKISGGQWKFKNKKECKYTLSRNNSNIATRVDNQNEDIDNVSKKWAVGIDVPHIAEVERLT